MTYVDSKVHIAQFPNHSRLNPLLNLYRLALTNAGVTVHQHSMYPAQAKREPCLSVRWLWQQRKKIHILHFHWYQRLYSSDTLKRTPLKFLLFLCQIFFARLLGYRITWTAHNLLPHETQFPRLDKIARWLVTSQASVVFVDSDVARLAVKQTFPWIRHFEVVPHGHMVGVYPSGEPQAVARLRLGIPEQAFVFVTFGLIRAYKGVEHLIEIFVEHLAGPDCYLIVAGDPHTPQVRSRLIDLAQSSPYIKLELNFIPPEQVENIFSASNVGVFPFSSIFTSSSTILCCSLQRPAIIPRLGALSAFEHEGVLLYDPQEPEGLLQCMRDARKMDWEQQGQRAKDQMLKRDWQEIGQHMARAFRAIVKN